MYMLMYIMLEAEMGKKKFMSMEELSHIQSLGLKFCACDTREPQLDQLFPTHELNTQSQNSPQLVFY